MKARRWWMSLPLLLGMVVVCRLPAGAAEKAELARNQAVEARMRKDLTFLSSDECEGRGPTTKGIDKAAEYIVAEFKKLGLKPATKNGSYFQTFTIPGNRLQKPPLLAVSHDKDGKPQQLKEGRDFNAMGLSSSGSLKDVEAVFAGYGVVGSKNFEYDDFKGIKVAGKVAIILRDTPLPGDRKANIDGQRRRLHGSLTSKMTNAEKAGAVAVLFVNDYDTAKDGDDLTDFNFTATGRAPSTKLPVFHIHRTLLDEMLQKSVGKKLAELEKQIDKELKPASVELKGWKVSLDVSTKREDLPARNIIGVLEGSGPLAKETVVIGAHYDHLGYGGTSSLAGLKKMAIHHGADDNGSGTTSILELARRFAEMPDRKGRRLVFMTFSCEEMGLLGSEHYCKHPLLPLADTIAMVNLDMVGRLAPDAKTNKDKLQVHGTGTAKTFDKLITDINQKYDFQLQKVATGFGPSDHASFYKQKIPVFFFFTGDHKDYHRPSDTVEKINFPGMRRVVDLSQEVISYLATVPQRPEYVQIKNTPRVGGVSGPRLGFAPEYGDEGDGVLVGNVSEGMPAAKAGIKAGDRIVELGGKPIKDLEGYMIRMQDFKLGQTIEVGILRDKKKQTIKVKLE